MAVEPVPPLGVYIHWPFCAAKCPYCDFNSHVEREVDHARWRRALIVELEWMAQQTAGHLVGSVFFGGGTPSLMEPQTVSAVLDAVADHWSLANDLEVTLEANPTSVEAAKFQSFADAGVNRVSIGVQALNDPDLRALGRLHTADEARRAFQIARAQFSRVSFDLIYARQNQTAETWEAELGEALSMAVDHLSLYQLTIENGTAFGTRHAQGNLRGLPDETLAVDLYDLTQAMCTAAGIPAYEVSNHARPGAECRHNLLYWQGGEYVGIGPGAHGRVGAQKARAATATLLQPNTWIDRVEVQGHGIKTRDQLPTREIADEYLMMSLRLGEGSDMGRYTELAGRPLDPAALAGLVAEGLVSVDGERLKTTPRGRLLLNSVLRALL